MIIIQAAAELKRRQEEVAAKALAKSKTKANHSDTVERLSIESSKSINSLRSEDSSDEILFDDSDNDFLDDLMGNNTFGKLIYHFFLSNELCMIKVVQNDF